ncbi:MAG: hypothetical protein LBQ15_02210 [Clostridium sp.]|jgi:hypothetical protein|nr:hypothetical protein [Clostridium sp.]
MQFSVSDALEDLSPEESFEVSGGGVGAVLAIVGLIVIIAKGCTDMATDAYQKQTKDGTLK